MLIPASLAFALTAPFVLSAQITLRVQVSPPPLPYYDQPSVPLDDSVWTPGYWAYEGDDYYWVPGTWVMAPAPGLLWTPGYWGWEGGWFLFHSGYWATHVGFYGGINYGHGYSGSGYQGGRWEGGHVRYNRSVTTVDARRTSRVYSQPVRTRTVKTAFNGGPGGLRAAPTRQERAAGAERHEPPTPDQDRHDRGASQNRDLRNSANHGRPPVAATGRPADFTPGSSVPAKAPPERRPEPKRPNAEPAHGPSHAQRPAQPRQPPAAQAAPRERPALDPPRPRPDPPRREAPAPPHPERPVLPRPNGQPQRDPGPARERPNLDPPHREAPHAQPAPHPDPGHGREREDHPKP
ncbi:hypothetical protein [Geothrix sp. 21YS21S-2]|uniref:hypothetical protein n=1 Tax=Geothrix sp. 21YS21S-2 TaxID=3068893 RepID=UPI0027BAEF1C|nr:hypothetical protein [Geothrix sp. 21YS21S-2]